MIKKIAIIGASGYTGAQMSALIYAEQSLSIYGVYVSENSDIYLTNIVTYNFVLLYLFLMKS